VTATAPRVAVLIVTRNRRGDLLETLEAVAALDHPADRLEVLVLDNGSEDATSQAVETWRQAASGRRLSRVECVRSAENLGASAARNRLAARASAGSDLFFVLDDDAVPEPAFLRRVRGALGDDPAVGVVGGRIVAFDDPGRDLAGAGFIDWRLGRFREESVAAAVDCDFVITCAMVIRPSAFRAAAGFDEDYFVYHEDVDFCVRVARQGFRVRYEPSARARHKVPPGKTRTPDRLYYLLRNKYLFLRKHLPPRRHPLAWLAYATGLIPRMLVQSIAVNRGLAPRELRTILAAGCDGLRGRTGRWR
jgi:GT2 family glycosyltransferase